jgi:hypothetical protein
MTTNFSKRKSIVKTYKESKEGKYTVSTWPNGFTEYRVSGELHRDEVDGAAVFGGQAGTTEYWSNGVFHRLNGPARFWPDGEKEYYIDGEEVMYFEHDILYDNWISIPDLDYVGPFKRISVCFIELPFKVMGENYIQIYLTKEG